MWKPSVPHHDRPWLGRLAGRTVCLGAMEQPDEPTRLILDAYGLAMAKGPGAQYLQWATEAGVKRLQSVMRRLLQETATTVTDPAWMRETYAAKRAEAEAAGDADAAAIFRLIEKQSGQLPIDRGSLINGLSKGSDQIGNRTRALARAALLTFAHAACEDVSKRLLEATRFTLRPGRRKALERREVPLSRPASEISEDELDAAITKKLGKRRALQKPLPYWVNLLLDVCGASLSGLVPTRDDHWVEDMHELRRQVVHGSPLHAEALGDEELAEFVMLPVALCMLVMSRSGIDPTAPEYAPYAIFSVEQALSADITWERFSESWETIGPMLPYFDDTDG